MRIDMFRFSGISQDSRTNAGGLSAKERSGCRWA